MIAGAFPPPTCFHHINLSSSPRYPQFLLDSGDSFTSATTVGELELWYRMYQLVAGPYGEILEEVPGMQKFYHRMSNLKGPKALVEDRTKFGSLMNYFVPVPA